MKAKVVYGTGGTKWCFVYELVVGSSLYFPFVRTRYFGRWVPAVVV